MVDGKKFANFVEQTLAIKGISKGEFYNAVGISATALYGWKRGAEPKQETVEAVERFLGVSVSAFDNPQGDTEVEEILEWIREDFSHRALFNSAKGLTAEQAYAVASFIEKLKAGDT